MTDHTNSWLGIQNLTNNLEIENSQNKDHMKISEYTHMRIQREDRRSGPHLENQNAIGFLSNTGLKQLKNQKATKTAFNVGPS